jgi:ribonuclease BN (tRNA processing enzyme)
MKAVKKSAVEGVTVGCTVVTSGGAFTGPSVLVSLSRKQLLGGQVKAFKGYLFNSCEGFQRACKESRLKLNGIEQLFFTSLCSDRFLGLPGLALGLGDVGASSLTVHGPEGTCEYVDACRPFFPKTWPKVQTIANIPRKSESLVLCDDEFFKIVAIPVGGIPEPPPPSLSHGASPPLRKKRRTDRSGAASADPPLIVYICEGKGEIAGSKFAFVECCVSNEWAHRVSFWIKTFHADCQAVYHFFPPAGVPLWQIEGYKDAWRADGEVDVKHVFLQCTAPSDTTGEGDMFASSDRFQAELHGVAPAFFPLPAAEPGRGGREGGETGEEIAANAAEVMKEILGSAGPKAPMGVNEQAAATLRRQLQGAGPAVAGHRPLEMIFLGTGSAAPSKLRNSSAILFRNPNYAIGSILIDVGEGTFAQMFRALGSQEKVDGAIRSLGLIWISHHHIDHHLGLLRLLERRAQLISAGVPLQPLVVIGPRSVRAFIDKTMPLIARTVRYIDFSEYQRLPDVQHIMFQFVGIQFLQSVPVIHCRDSFGLVLQLRSGEKIVYSGDTRPCKSLAQAGKGATLLVHEATFDDSMQEAAKKKRHSTFSEALGIGHDMGAKFVMLTHFSQRYPRSIALRKGVQFEEKDGPEGRDLAKKEFVLAFDLMRVEVSTNGLTNAIDATQRLTKYFTHLQQQRSKSEPTDDTKYRGESSSE